ncbi:MAG: biopolymer transporter ExbD [Myxococcota bacterium]
MRGRRRHTEDFGSEAEESGELNLTPYLDVVSTLVIFLIFTFQVVIEFRLIELLPPAYSANARNPSETPENQDVTLTLIIHTDGYRLVTNKPEMGASEVPKKNGEYDNDKLAQELSHVKKTLGLRESLILTASDDIEYKVVVAALDTAREYEGELLFPDVLLAKASAGGGG